VAHAKNIRRTFRVIVWKSEVKVDRRTEVGWAWIRMMRLRIGTGDRL
jgi:hypothetical protein